MTEYRKGQRVKVELEGTVYSVLSGCHGEVTGVYVDSGKGCKHYLYPAHATVTVLDPPDWPPQVGDIWEADGEEYYVRTRAGKDGILIHSFSQINARYDFYWCPEGLEDFKALNPVLVRRRGQ